MRVVRYDRFSGVDQLSIDEVPTPEAAPGHAVVQVHASCINPGSLSALHGSPYVPIRDLAGTVTAVGAGVDDVEVGDEVLGWSQDWLAHAEFVAVPAEQLVAKPAGLSWDVAGSLYVTPMAGLAGVKAVQPRERDVVVVSGASGGVGLTAAQLARRDGATVIGIAGPDNADRLREHGVIPVSYGDQVAEDIRTAADGRRIDAFIDAFGSGYVDLALALGVPKERINTVVDYQAAKEKGVKALGTQDAGGGRGLRDLADLAASGELAVPIAATYPLAEVQAAYKALAESRPFGRIVLHPQA
jgi:NADPH:quinone reductase-like Zn-dependent oxidoreductase